MTINFKIQIMLVYIMKYFTYFLKENVDILWFFSSSFSIIS